MNTTILKFVAFLTASLKLIIFLVVMSLTSFTSNEKQNLLFNVDNFLEIPMEDFEKNWWQLVSNVWIQWNSYKLENGNYWKVFACRFTKHQESSIRQKENILNEKRRIIKTRPSGLCKAKIKVLWLVLLKKIKIERYKDSPNYEHLLLESDRIKRSQAIRTLVEKKQLKIIHLQRLLLLLKNMQ